MQLRRYYLGRLFETSTVAKMKLIKQVTIICLGFIIALLLPVTSVQAQSLDIPVGEVCSLSDGINIMNNHKTIGWLYKKFPVSYKVQDYNGDHDPTNTDRLLAMLDQGQCDEVGCEASESTNFIASRDLIKEFLEKVQAGKVKGYRFKESLEINEVTETVDPNELFDDLPLAREPFVIEQEYILSYRFLAGLSSVPAILCEDTSSATTSSGSESKKPSFSKSKLRVRGKVEELRPRLSPDNRKRLSSALFSISDNRVSDVTEYSVQGVFGYELANYGSESGLEDGSYSINLIPFVGIDRRFATGSDEGEVNNVSVGLDFNIDWILNENSIHTFDIYPAYTFNNESDTRIGSLKATWTPNWFFEGFGSFPNIARILGKNAKYGHLYPTLTFDVAGGHVFELGDNEELEDSAEFF